MSINYTEESWKAVRKTYEKWWQRKLERPIISVIIKCHDPDRPEPDVPILNQANCIDLTIPAEKLIDRMDYELSQYCFLGDAFPYFSMASFGPGVIAAFLGAQMEVNNGLVWFHPNENKPIEELSFCFNPDNVWFQRLCDIYKAGYKRWEGNVLMSMTDIGGNLDVLSAFLPGETLIYDLYDKPDEVKRLIWEAHRVWFDYFHALNKAMGSCPVGYSDWSGLFYEQPGYILQSDFSYMIGPEMFREFALPELRESVKKLPHSFFHLDGKGMLPLFDHILEIEELDGIQWVPGDGNPDCSKWPDIYRKISKKGKLVQLHGDFETLDAVAEQVGSFKGIQLRNKFSGDIFYNRAEGMSEMEIRKKLALYGIE